MRLYQGPGVRHALADRPRGFDVVFANILARPLKRLAPTLTAVVADDGVLILSGLIERDVPGVLSTYRHRGFHLARSGLIEGWATLVLRRGGGRPGGAEYLAQYTFGRCRVPATNRSGFVGNPGLHRELATRASIRAVERLAQHHAAGRDLDLSHGCEVIISSSIGGHGCADRHGQPHAAVEPRMSRSVNTAGCRHAFPIFDRFSHAMRLRRAAQPAFSTNSTIAIINGVILDAQHEVGADREIAHGLVQLSLYFCQRARNSARGQLGCNACSNRFPQTMR